MKKKTLIIVGIGLSVAAACSLPRVVYEVKARKAIASFVRDYSPELGTLPPVNNVQTGAKEVGEASGWYVINQEGAFQIVGLIVHQLSPHLVDVQRINVNYDNEWKLTRYSAHYFSNFEWSERGFFRSPTEIPPLDVHSRLTAARIALEEFSNSHLPGPAFVQSEWRRRASNQWVAEPWVIQIFEDKCLALRADVSKLGTPDPESTWLLLLVWEGDSFHIDTATNRTVNKPFAHSIQFN